MFKSANHQTFVARALEVLATVAGMWFCMLLMISLFKVSGLFAVDFSNNIPLLGVSTNYLWLHSGDIPLGEALVSPFVVIGVLGTVLFAPLVEEILFRGFVCGSVASDENGKLRAQGLFAVLAGSFILFGLAHGQGYFSIMVQGVGGLLLAQLWFRNGSSKAASYFSCVAAHGLYNTSVVVTVWLMAS